MASSIKSMIIEALSQHLNLDSAKREFYQTKYKELYNSTQFPTTSRHKNTIMDIVEAFVNAGVDASQINWVDVKHYKKVTKVLEISLPTLLLKVSEFRESIYLQHDSYNYSIYIENKDLKFLANFYLNISNIQTDWNKEWEDLLNKCSKRAKLRSMNEVSIEAILHDKLKGTGLKYRLKRQQYRVTLTLVMKHNVQATFIIQHSKFRAQLDMVLPAVMQLNDLMDELGQPIKIKTLERNANWDTIE